MWTLESNSYLENVKSCQVLIMPVVLIKRSPLYQVERISL